MMLSESQERMLMVLRPEKEAEARAVFEKWELDFATIGVTTDDLRFRVSWQGQEVANLPIKELGDEAPEYDRPWVKPPPQEHRIPNPGVMDIADALLRLIGGPNGASRRWVFEQYDTLIGGNSLQLPGGDAGVIRIDGHPEKALAFTSDVNPHYCAADPFEGGKQAVAEAWRNLTASGATPLAATDNLNFGNPEKPEIMGQLVEAIRGIGEACRALDFPIVSGNVSLYNETQGQGILPTPTIGGVGLIPDWTKMAGIGFAGEGEILLLIGAPAGWGSHLGQSTYLRELFDRRDGAPPPVDLAAERRNGDFVRGLIRAGTVTAVHDLSDGGLAVALAEMAMAGGIGATIGTPEGTDLVAAFFGEDQGRYVLAVAADLAGAVLADAGAHDIPCTPIGTTGGGALTLGNARPLPVAELGAVHEAWFPRYMAGEL
jgi:phosphoribosylformylglycinamidine synthase